MRSPQRIWDLPVRLTHWLLAGLIVFSWWTAETHRLDLHIWSGCGILALLIFRLLWGLFGSSTARFSNFVRGPRAVRDYLRGTWRGLGHNPLGALSVIALLGAVAVQDGLGLFAQDDDGIYTGPLYRLVSSDTSDAIRRIHESWFNVVWVLAALHIAAILFYRVVRGKKLTGAMISGKGDVEAGIAPMRPGKWWVALLCLIVAIGITRWVIAGAPPFGP
jgi:cytochrome b